MFLFIYLNKICQQKTEQENSEKCASNLNYEIKIWCLTLTPHPPNTLLYL